MKMLRKDEVIIMIRDGKEGVEILWKKEIERKKRLERRKDFLEWLRFIFVFYILNFYFSFLWDICFILVFNLNNKY